MKVGVRIVLSLMVALGLPAHGQFSRIQPDGTGRSGTVSPAAPAPGRVGGGAVFRETFSLSWETRVVSPEPGLEQGFETRTVAGTGTTTHRIMLDRLRRTYFGYNILIETLSEAQAYRVTLSPLAASPEMTALLIPDPSPEWKSMPQPRFPAPMIIRSGDTFVFDVLVNKATDQRVEDRLTVEDPSRKGTNAP